MHKDTLVFHHDEWYWKAFLQIQKGSKARRPAISLFFLSLWKMCFHVCWNLSLRLVRSVNFIIPWVALRSLIYFMWMICWCLPIEKDDWWDIYWRCLKSVQSINLAKLAIFFSIKINNTRTRGLQRLLGFTKGTFPFTYLGVPLILGRMIGWHFDPLIH